MSLWGFDTLALINAQMWNMSILILSYKFIFIFIYILHFSFMKNDKTIITIAETTYLACNGSAVDKWGF